MPTQSAAHHKIQRWLKKTQVVEYVVATLNQAVRFRQPLRIVIGANQGPVFDPQSREIRLPYEFVASLAELIEIDEPWGLDIAGLSSSRAQEYTLSYVLFHQLAHALIHLNSLPVVESEEGAAQELTAVLMLEFANDAGGRLQATDIFRSSWFYEEGWSGEGEYWSLSHGLESPSFGCWIYGSDPKQYATYMEPPQPMVPTCAIGNTKEVRAMLTRTYKKMLEGYRERSVRCLHEYPKLRKTWLTVLQTDLLSPTIDVPKQ